MHVDDVGADGGMARHAEAQPYGRGGHGQVQVRRLGVDQLTPERTAEALGRALLGMRAALGRGRQRAPGLVRETELAGGQLRVDVLAGEADGRDLVVVDRPRAVQRDIGHDAALHQVDDQRCQSGLQHVRTHRHHDRSASQLGGDDALDELLEVRAGVDVGQRIDERSEPGHGRRHLTEVGGRHQAGTGGQRLERQVLHLREGMARSVGRGRHGRSVGSGAEASG